MAGQSGQLRLPTKLAKSTSDRDWWTLLCSMMSDMTTGEVLESPTLLSLPEDLFIAIASRLDDRAVCKLELANTRLYNVLLQSNCAWPCERRLDLLQFGKWLPTPETLRSALSLRSSWAGLMPCNSA